MKITEKQNNIVELSTDSNHILHLINSTDYPKIRKTVISKDKVSDWEEISVTDIPSYSEYEYRVKVEELIRERYTISDEFALINNIMQGSTEKRLSEYNDYQKYREQCKIRAKEILNNLNNG